MKYVRWDIRKIADIVIGKRQDRCTHTAAGVVPAGNVGRTPYSLPYLQRAGIPGR